MNGRMDTKSGTTAAVTIDLLMPPGATDGVNPAYGPSTNVIDSISASVTASVAGVGTLTVTDQGVTRFSLQFAIAASTNTIHIPFVNGTGPRLSSSVTQQVSLTYSGATVSAGRLNVGYHSE